METAPFANLPAPELLGPANALTLASELIANDVLDPAIPYLVYALKHRPTAFGLCRLAKVCHRRGDCRDAVRFYDLALRLEPANPWAVIGRADALSDCLDASLEELTTAAEAVAGVASGDHLISALFTVSRVLSAASRMRPHVVLDHLARSLYDAARALRADTRPTATGGASRERLVDALRLLAELHPAEHSSAISTPATSEELTTPPQPLLLQPAVKEST